MTHSTRFWGPSLLAILCGACSGEVNTVSASTQNAGTGGTAATGGAGGPQSDESGRNVDGGVGGSGAGPAPGQEILFAVTYNNDAWGPLGNGVFITKDGSVFEYDYYSSDAGTATTPPPPPMNLTDPVLLARWRAVTGLVAQLPVEVVKTRFAAVQSAARGVLLYSGDCYDAGELTYLGYLYEPATATYSRVVLGMYGDRAAKNLAPGADGLVRWLATVRDHGEVCAFMATECTGAVCAQPPPVCSSGFVPSVENGCWGACVPVSRCLEVPDCSWCGDTICATSESGSHHCTTAFCSGLGPCACHGSPCGGGLDYCTAESGVAVSCDAR